MRKTFRRQHRDFVAITLFCILGLGAAATIINALWDFLSGK